MGTREQFEFYFPFYPSSIVNVLPITPIPHPFTLVAILVTDIVIGNPVKLKKRTVVGVVCFILDFRVRSTILQLLSLIIGFQTTNLGIQNNLYRIRVGERE